MTETPYDALFKAAFETPADAAGVFRRALPPTLVEAITWDTISSERGSFIDPELGSRHSDLLFSARLRDRPVLLYLLLEHQSTNDPDIPLRVLIYLVRIWERFRKDPEHAGEPLPPIIPLVVSHAPGGWTAPRSFHALFDPDPATLPALAELVPSFTIVVEDLSGLSNDDIKSLAIAAFPTLALWALRDARDAATLLRNLQHWTDALLAVLRSPFAGDALGQLMRYISLVVDPLDLDAFRAKIREQIPAAEGAIMTIAEQMLNKGRAEGRAEGRAQVLVTLLTLKFGAITSDDEARLRVATPEQLDRYVERVLTAETLAAVFAE